MHTQKPYLLPVSPFFPDLSSALVMEIPVGGGCDCVACSPCGRYIAAGAGHDVVVADSVTGEILKRLQGHTETVLCVVFAPGSQKVISGSVDTMIILWEWESPKSSVEIFKGHKKAVTSIATSSDGERIFSASEDHTMRIWNATAGAQTSEFLLSSDVYCSAVCPEDRLIALGLEDGTLKVLDSSSKQWLFEDAGAHEGRITSVAFSPDGLSLVSGSKDKTIRVWQTDPWTRIDDPLEGHGDWVTCVAFSPNGKQVASSSSDGTVRVWDTASAKCTGISPKLPVWLKSALFTPDGRRIISGSLDNTVRIWDAHLGMELQERRYQHSDEVLGVTISPNGLLVASASGDGTVRLWDSGTGEPVGAPLEGHKDHVICVTFSPDGRKIVTGSFDKTLRLWDIETLTQIGDPFEGHGATVSCASFSSDGCRILSGSYDKTVRQWNVETGKQVADPLLGHESALFCVAESSDGLHLVSQDYFSDSVIIWDRVEQAAIDINDEEAEKIIRSCGRLTPHLWPRSFPAYSAEAYLEDVSVYSNLLGEKTLLTTLPDSVSYMDWNYHDGRKVFVAGLITGAVAISKLVVE